MKTKIQKIKKKCDDLLRKVIRLRDDDTCQKCGKKIYGCNSQPSHVIPKSRCQYLRWNLLNVKLLCNHCHCRWWHLNPIAASEWFKEKFPARYDYVKQTEHVIVHWKLADYEKIKADLTEKLRELEK